jgi:Fe-S-cluster containining protein
MMWRDERWKFFACQRCGRCCGKLPYDPNSILEIAKFLALTVAQVIEKYYGTVIEEGRRFRLDDHKREPCPFLKSDGETQSCAIYTVRPEGCKGYPYETMLGEADVGCPAYALVKQILDDGEESIE